MIGRCFDCERVRLRTRKKQLVVREPSTLVYGASYEYKRYWVRVCTGCWSEYLRAAQRGGKYNDN